MKSFIIKNQKAFLLAISFVIVFCLAKTINADNFGDFLKAGSTFAQSSETGLEKLIVCKKNTEIRLPGNIVLDLAPNELEMPIGKATDRTEEMAERIIEQARIIIDASARQIAASQTMVSLVSQCGSALCQTGCNKYTEDCFCTTSCESPCDSNCGGLSLGTCGINNNGVCDTSGCSRTTTCTPRYICEVLACNGNPCPAGIAEQLGIVNAQATRITNAYNIINRFFPIVDVYDNRFYDPIGFWWLPCPFPYPPSVGGVLGSYLPFNLIAAAGGAPAQSLALMCKTTVESILEQMLFARSGDYQYPSLYAPSLGNLIAGEYSILGLEWDHSPPGLKDCVDRPGDIEAIASGEKTGEFIMTCKEALDAATIDPEHCYGNTVCENDPSAENCPRTENYYCCE